MQEIVKLNTEYYALITDLDELVMLDGILYTWQYVESIEKWVLMERELKGAERTHICIKKGCDQQFLVGGNEHFRRRCNTHKKGVKKR